MRFVYILVTWEYSEPSLQRYHLFPKTLMNLLWYKILHEQIDMKERSCFVHISSLKYVLDIC